MSLILINSKNCCVSILTLSSSSSAQKETCDAVKGSPDCAISYKQWGLVVNECALD